MAQVGVARFFDRVVIDVNHVVEHAHRRSDGFLQLDVVQHGSDAAAAAGSFASGSGHQMLQQVDRAQVAHRCFRVAGVECDLGAQVAGVHDTRVLLRRADVAGILEGDPRMPGFKQHGEHLAPQVGCLHCAGWLDLAALRLGLVDYVGAFKLGPKFVVQVGHVVGREQGPLAFFHHAAHEKVGNPVGGVHVVGAAAVVTRVLAQFQKLFNVKVPGFQVGANRALAFAALVDGDRCVVDHFEKWDNALRFAVGSLDVAA